MTQVEQWEAERVVWLGEVARGELSAHLSEQEGKAMLDTTMVRSVEEALMVGEERRIELVRRAKLTKRERDVLLELSHGYSNAALASRLKISEWTAKFHVNNLLTKFSARSRAHAVALAFRARVLA